eukprot:gene94-128_t
MIDGEDFSKPFSLVDKGGSIPNLKTTDQVIEEIGFGRYHVKLLIITGFAVACEAMELSLLLFLQGCAVAEWGLSDNEKSMLGSAVGGGQMIGLILSGTLADKYGRRSVVFSGWVFIIIFGLASSLSQNIWTLVFFRFLVGVGISSQVIMFDIAVEILPMETRGSLLACTSAFYVFGELFVAGFAYTLLDAYGWRWLVFATAMPTILVLIFGIFYVPESPRWLVSQHRHTDAEVVLAHICHENRRVISSYTLKRTYSEKYKEGSLQELFSRKLYFITFRVWPIWFSQSFIYYSLVIAVSVYFQVHNRCEFKYEYIFLINSAGLIGVAVAFQLMELGRRMNQTFMAIVGCLFAVILAFAHHTNIETIILVMGSKACTAGVSTICWIHVAELYPTEAQVLVAVVFSNRIGGDLFPIGLAIACVFAMTTYCAYNLP